MKQKTEQNIVTGEVRIRLSYAELGNKMIAQAGPDACQKAYGTTDPRWVGHYALTYGDISSDGTLN